MCTLLGACTAQAQTAQFDLVGQAIFPVSLLTCTTLLRGGASFIRGRQDTYERRRTAGSLAFRLG